MKFFPDAVCNRLYPFYFPTMPREAPFPTLFKRALFNRPRESKENLFPDCCVRRRSPIQFPPPGVRINVGGLYSEEPETFFIWRPSRREVFFLCLVFPPLPVGVPLSPPGFLPRLRDVPVPRVCLLSSGVDENKTDPPCLSLFQWRTAFKYLRFQRVALRASARPLRTDFRSVSFHNNARIF